MKFEQQLAFVLSFNYITSYYITLPYIGHLMPMDLPAISLDLIARFVNGKTFADQALPSEQSYLETTVGTVPRVLFLEY